MSEQLHIQGLGSTREAALADADAQALTYFGTTPTIRDIGTASATDREMSGAVIAWSVVCIYRPANPSARPPRNPYEAS